MFYAAGDYQKAMTQLSEGFNINSLKFRFDVAYAKAITDKFNNNAKGMVASLMMKKQEERKAEGGEGLSAISHMREKVADTQDKMPPENFEDKKIFNI